VRASRPRFDRPGGRKTKVEETRHVVLRHVNDLDRPARRLGSDRTLRAACLSQTADSARGRLTAQVLRSDDASPVTAPRLKAPVKNEPRHYPTYTSDPSVYTTCPNN
jgi:predicted secreted protein